VAVAVCCAGLPALATLVSGVTLGALFGVAGGILLAAALLGVGLLVIRVRRRRRSSPTTGARL